MWHILRPTKYSNKFQPKSYCRHIHASLFPFLSRLHTTLFFISVKYTKLKEFINNQQHYVDRWIEWWLKEVKKKHIENTKRYIPCISRDSVWNVCINIEKKEIGKAYKLSLARKAAKNNRKMCVYVYMFKWKHQSIESKKKEEKISKKSQAVNSSRKNQWPGRKWSWFGIIIMFIKAQWKLRRHVLSVF